MCFFFKSIFAFLLICKGNKSPSSINTSTKSLTFNTFNHCKLKHWTTGSIIHNPLPTQTNLRIYVLQFDTKEIQKFMHWSFLTANCNLICKLQTFHKEQAFNILICKLQNFSKGKFYITALLLRHRKWVRCV